MIFYWGGSFQGGDLKRSYGGEILRYKGDGGGSRMELGGECRRMDLGGGCSAMELGNAQDLLAEI